MIDTLTFNPVPTEDREIGWESRYSFQPEGMVGLNNTLFSFKGGNLYIHDSVNVDRCEFYGVKYPCSVTTEFNVNPLDKKMFKTIHLDSDHAWDVDCDTDLGVGEVAATSFELKEGDFFGYIRSIDSLTIDSENAASTTTQGLGVVQSVALNIITFTSEIDTYSFSIGDRVFKESSGSFVYIGNIVSFTANSVTLSGIASPVSASMFMVSAKNRVSESIGCRGYYMSTVLTNNDSEQVELFAVSSSIFKSYP